MRFKIGLIIFLACIPAVSGADVLKLCSYVSPPYQVLEGAVLKGKAVEEMSCVLGKMGSSHDTKVKPWLRCEEETINGSFDGLYTVTPKSELSGKLVFSNPLALERWYWFYKGDLNPSAMTLGAIRGSNQDTWLEAQGYKVKSKANTMDQLYKLLENDRIDGFIADESVEKEASFPSGVNKKFLRYLPLGAYFSKNFINARGDFLDKFNSHIHECQPEKIGLSDADKAALKLLAEKIKSAINGDVLSAIVAQNEKHAALDESQIITLDKKWRNKESAEGKAFRDEVLANSVSAVLKQMKTESAGIYSEIFIMDNKGLNVGQSDVTSDYWQGDEAKFKKSYGVGPEAVFIDDIEFDQSSQTFQSQVNLTIADASGAAIGAITVGVNVEKALAAQ